MKIEMNLNEFKKRIEMIEVDKNLGNFLEQINFQLAENTPWPEYKTLDNQIKKVELLYKTYILACVKDNGDKDLRIETMKIFKDLLETLPKCLTRYRDHVKKELAEIKKETKKKKECKAP